jgi:DNA-binding response OmpR family regulator
MAHILVLDDEPDAVVLLQRLLQCKGHEVATFTIEEEAIAYVRSHQVDLAILDIRLRRMSGIEVLGELKEIHPAMRALILTGSPTAETEKQAAALGANDYCTKPIDIQDLQRKVTSIIGRKD